MQIEHIEGLHDEVIYVTVDGRDYELSEYQGRDDLPCMKCGRPEEFDADADECIRSLYTSTDDMFLCSDCLEESDKASS